MTKLEEIARAMWAHRDRGLAGIEGGLAPSQTIRRPTFEQESEIWKSLARAAVEAMREPNADMVEMGFIKPEPWGHDTETVQSCWTAMIDAILNEKQD